MADADNDVFPGVLSKDQILERVQGSNPLVTGWISLDEQVQPNGFDLTLAEIYRHSGQGVIGIDNADRRLPDLDALHPDDSGFFDLDANIYHIVYQETVHLPTDLMAFGRPRSSLNRSGVTIHTAVWDAGYEGRSTSLLNVLNPGGFRVQRGARVMQLVFLGLSRPTSSGYRGVYHGENAT